MDAGQRAAEVEGKGQKESACGCSTLAGRLQPAKPTGLYAAVCLAELATDAV